jgi:Uri superfamily endonuclease
VELPRLPGTYVLVLELAQECTLVVGALGAHRFPAGTYLYVGSACGPGGLRGRLAHHLRPVQRPHWHVDYLRQFAVVREIWYSTEPEPRECRWAAVLAAAGFRTPMPGFGASDCRCAAHLFQGAAASMLSVPGCSAQIKFNVDVRTALDYDPLNVVRM